MWLARARIEMWKESRLEPVVEECLTRLELVGLSVSWLRWMRVRVEMWRESRLKAVVEECLTRLQLVG